MYSKTLKYAITQEFFLSPLVFYNVMDFHRGITIEILKHDLKFINYIISTFAVADYQQSTEK